MVRLIDGRPYERAWSTDTRAGIACRMISDLGLHETTDDTEIVGTQSCHLLSSVALRRALLCCAVTYEGVWCTYLGRPSCISMSAMNTAVSRQVYLTDSGSSVLDAWVGLCEPMAEVTEILNNSCLSNRVALDHLSKLDSRLHTWYESLPPELTCSNSQIVDLDVKAYGLQMQFCKIQILLHQPSGMIDLYADVDARLEGASSVHNLGKSVRGGVLPGWTQEQSREVVYQSAGRIVRLFLTYRQLFGVDSIPSIMLDNISLAARTLISHNLQLPDSQAASERDITWLLMILGTMEALRIYYPFTQRMIGSLALMVKGTPLEYVFPTKSNELLHESQLSAGWQHNTISSPAADNCLMSGMDSDKFNNFNGFTGVDDVCWS